MKKTEHRKSLPLRRERIRELTGREAREMAVGGSMTTFSITITTLPISLYFHCMEEMQPE
jgi:hypothetical protein